MKRGGDVCEHIHIYCHIRLHFERICQKREYMIG